MILWEFPLAFGSFLFHGAVKTFMRVALMAHDARNRKDAEAWIVLSKDDMLARPAVLPLIMTTAPRWNTHAILATLSPVPVKEFIEIDAASANRSAGYWTIVVCTYAGRETVTSVGSLSDAGPEGRVRIDLKPGAYWLGLRYYEWRTEVELPAVSADGVRVARSQPIPAAANDFYQNLQTRSNWFYLALHYYVFVLLRHRSLFPEKFVKREFLPMGNPETEFFWGALRKGEELRGRIAPQALANWNLLLTVYNRASFPIQSERLLASDLRFTAPVDCTYLLRVNRKTRQQNSFPGDWLQLRVE
jgi:hypothetical protein